MRLFPARRDATAARRLNAGLLLLLALTGGCDPNAGPKRSDAPGGIPPLPHPSDASAPPFRPLVAPEPSLRGTISGAPETLRSNSATPSLPTKSSDGASPASALSAGVVGPPPSILFEDLTTGARGYYTTNGSILGAFTPIATVPPELRIVASADFTGDNVADLLFENTRDGSRWVLQLNASDVAVTWRAVNAVPTQWHIAGAGSLTNGVTPDILWENTVTGEIGLYRMNGTTVLGWTPIGRVDPDLRMVGVGDLTGDGRLDLVFENLRDGGRWVLQMNGATAVAWRGIGPMSTELRIRGVGDFTGDGQLDLLFENTRDGSRWILRMVGTSAQAWIALATLPTSWHIAGTRDRSAAPTGSLSVTIVGLPSGVPANIGVTGTNTASTVNVTSTLSNLPPGAYTVTAPNVTANGVTYSAIPSSQAVTVIANTTANVTVTYGAADLVISAVTGAATGAVGGTISVSGTVRNQGATTTGAFRLGFYLSTDAAITTTDVLFAACTYSGGLAGNSSSTCSGSALVPSSLPPGTYYVGAIADDLAQLGESNESNNARASSTTTTLASAVPDFVVDVVTAPASGTIGDVISVSATVRNQAATTTSAFRVGFYYSTDATITSADVFSGSGCTVASGLAANATSICSLTIPAPNALPPGTYYIGVIVDDVLQVSESNESNNTRASLTTTTLSSGSNVPVPPYSITVRFLTSMTPSQQAAFTNAAARWSSIITNDVPDAAISVGAGACGSNSPAMNETVDDLVIFATIEPIDGPGGILGSAGPCFIRNASGLPIVGTMRFDAADVANLEASGSLGSVILHEMGHVLGIGTLWSFPPSNFLQNPSPASGPALDTYYSGANGIAGFNAIGGATYTGGSKVPVENVFGGGTINAHWRESVLGNELLTGFLNPGANPLSRLTVQSLADLGYVVNVAAADPFFLNTSLRADAAPPANAIALGNDVLIGPLYSVGPDGQVRRIR